MIHRLREVLRFENRYVQVFEDDVRFDDGTDGTYLRIGPPPARGTGVVLLPLVGQRLGLVQTYRYPVSSDQWGFPRGFGEAVDADPSATAARELAEEIGPADASFRVIGWVTPDSGMLNTRVAVVVAEMAEEIAAPTDHAEVRAVRWVGVDELWGLVADGAVEDGFTLSSLALATATGTVGPR